MKCFYHSADLDGKCSAAIVLKGFEGLEMEALPINYGNPFPWDSITEGELVYMVDFGLQPFSDMLRLNDMADLIWIDHHKTAIQAHHDHGIAPEINGLRRVGEAGCELTWQFVFPGRPMPDVVRLLGRYDVWDHSDDTVLPFQYGMRLEDPEPESVIWESLLNGACIESIFRHGLVCLQYQNQQNAGRAKSCSFETELDGLRLIAMNHGMGNSQCFDTVYDKEKHDAMCLFSYRKGSWTFSLYSTKDDVDVGEFCKARGGGGHQGAAGFQCKILPEGLLV